MVAVDVATSAVGGFYTLSAMSLALAEIPDTLTKGLPRYPIVPVVLMGRLAVTAVGTLKTSNGVGHFELESASVGSIPIPKILLQEIVSYYSRTAEKPAGLSLDDPFALPARIREIQVERGQAIIVQ